MPASLLLICVSSLFRFSDALWIQVGQTVVVQQLGVASTDYSSWISATSFVAALAGIGLGVFIDRLGVKRFYLGALLAYGLLATAVGFSAFAWESSRFLMTVSALQAFVYQGVFVSFIAIHMKLCGTRVAATQFAIYMGVGELCALARCHGDRRVAAVLGVRPDVLRGRRRILLGRGALVEWRTCGRTNKGSAACSGAVTA